MANKNISIWYLLIPIFCILDAYFTLMACGIEVNPVMDIFLKIGPTAFFIFKYVMTCVGVFLLASSKNIKISKIACIAINLIYLVLCVWHIVLINISDCI